jgi:hypothetical protein
MKITALLINFALITAPAVSLAATCTRADFVGTWRIYTVFDSVARCTLVIANNGAVANQSVCYLPDVVNSISLRGVLTLTPECRVIGTINANAQQRNIDAWISKGKDSISGMVWQTGNPFIGKVLSGIKQ